MSKRTEQVAELLLQEINKILVRDFEAPLGTFVSVSVATVAPDLKNATAYLSIMPSNKIGTVLEAVKRFTPHIQRIVNKTLKMRFVPRINWEIDERDLKYAIIDEALAK